MNITHAACRKRSVKSKVVHFIDVWKDFGPISTLIDIIDEIVEKVCLCCWT